MYIYSQIQSRTRHIEYDLRPVCDEAANTIHNTSQRRRYLTGKGEESIHPWRVERVQDGRQRRDIVQRYDRCITSVTMLLIQAFMTMTSSRFAKWNSTERQYEVCKADNGSQNTMRVQSHSREVGWNSVINYLFKLEGNRSGGWARFHASHYPHKSIQGSWAHCGLIDEISERQMFTFANISGELVYRRTDKGEYKQLIRWSYTDNADREKANKVLKIGCNASMPQPSHFELEVSAIAHVQPHITFITFPEFYQWFSWRCRGRCCDQKAPQESCPIDNRLWICAKGRSSSTDYRENIKGVEQWRDL